jgi:hypothetical protein
MLEEECFRNPGEQLQKKALSPLFDERYYSIYAVHTPTTSGRARRGARSVQEIDPNHVLCTVNIERTG